MWLTKKGKWREPKKYERRGLRKLKKLRDKRPGAWGSLLDSRRQRRHSRKEKNKGDAAADAVAFGVASAREQDAFEQIIASRIGGTGTVGDVSVGPFPDVGEGYVHGHGRDEIIFTPRFGVASTSNGGDASNRWL